MKRTIEINGKFLSYILVKRRNSKGISISIRPGGVCRVNAPRIVPNILIENFLRKKADWICEKVEIFKNVPIQDRNRDKKDFKQLKNTALLLASERLEHFNQTYKYHWNKISVRNQTSRWGSCSRRNNLSFNYKIALLPKELADYVIVHELCHLGEFNHSKNFWNLVARTFPEHKKLRSDLKKINLRNIF